MSAISGSCSESTAQTLFNQRIQELQQLRSKDDEHGVEDDSLASMAESKAGESGQQNAMATKAVTEAGKGQLLDLYVWADLSCLHSLGINAGRNTRWCVVVTAGFRIFAALRPE